MSTDTRPVISPLLLLAYLCLGGILIVLGTSAVIYSGIRGSWLGVGGGVGAAAEGQRVWRLGARD